MAKQKIESTGVPEIDKIIRSIPESLRRKYVLEFNKQKTRDTYWTKAAASFAVRQNGKFTPGTFCKLLSDSFAWCETEDGLEYWGAVFTLFNQLPPEYYRYYNTIGNAAKKLGASPVAGFQLNDYRGGFVKVGNTVLLIATSGAIYTYEQLKFAASYASGKLKKNVEERVGSVLTNTSHSASAVEDWQGKPGLKVGCQRFTSKQILDVYKMATEFVKENKRTIDAKAKSVRRPKEYKKVARVQERTRAVQ